MQVWLRDTAGGLSSASAKVHIGQTPAVSTAPAAPTQVLPTANPTSADGSEVQVSWSTADTTAAAWALKVNGVIVGGVSGASREVTLTDVRRSEGSVMGAPVTATGQVLPVVRPVRTRIWPAAFVEAQLATGETSGPAPAEVVTVTADAAVPSSSPAIPPAAAPITVAQGLRRAADWGRSCFFPEAL
jgi:hypothetical protein